MPLFAILTLFPDALAPYLGESILGLAQAKGQLEVRLVDFRDFTRDRHRTVDDRPFGGGPGMVLRPEPIYEAFRWLEERHGAFRKFALCPGGRPFRQDLATELAAGFVSGEPERARVALLCGRYEGFDERLRQELDLEALSIGDYVLSGGELPALVVVEAVARLLPGVLGDARSASEDSFAEPDLLDCPHYTRPRVWRSREVPEVLLSGNHERIRRWRRATALDRTRAQRPDLDPHAPRPARPADDRTPPATESRAHPETSLARDPSPEPNRSPKPCT